MDTDEQRASNEREQIEQVFGLTGGELMDVAWVPTYPRETWNFNADATGNHMAKIIEATSFTFTYWYQGVPDYTGHNLDPTGYTYTHRTVCEDETFGQVPEIVTDDEGTWKVVARYRSSGETECPYRDDDDPPIPTKANPCPLCDSWGMDMDVRGREDEEHGFHGYIYIGDGWAEIVYRLMPPAFTPDPNCDNCDGTGVFEVVNGEDIPCHFCLEDAIKRGEIEGTIGD